MHLRNIARLMILVLLLSQSWLAIAQTELLQFKRLTLAQGLSHSRVTCALQDREGFMWFGTQYGLNKYDGYTFKVFQSDPNDPVNTLQHNYIRNIHEDKAGRLWVITQGGGLHQVDKYTGKITSYALPPMRNNPWNVLFSFYEDSQGIFWLGAQLGLLRFDPRTKQFSHYKFEAPIRGFVEDGQGRYWVKFRKKLYQFDTRTGKFTTASVRFPGDKPPIIAALQQDAKGIIWVGTSNRGLFRLNTKVNPVQAEAYYPDKPVNANIGVRGIYHDRQGNIWLASTEGLQRVNLKNNHLDNFRANPQEPASLSSNDVVFAYQDRNNTIWIGTNNGINKADLHPKPFMAGYVVPAPSVRLRENNIRSILEDSAGTIWLSSWRTGLFSQHPRTRETRKFLPDSLNAQSLISKDIGAIYEDRKGRLWIGAGYCLHLLNRATHQFTRFRAKIPIQFIHEDRNGKLWLSGRVDSKSIQTIASFDPATGQYTYYTPPPDRVRLDSYNVYDLMISQTGDIWIGTLGGGINRLNPKTGKFTFYLPDYPLTKGHLNDVDVRTLYEDAAGIIWIGTNVGGLNRFDPRTGIFTCFTTREGLPSNRVESIIGDTKGHLWLGTNQGISRFNPKTKVFRNFDVTDGLPNNQFIEASVYSRNHKLMFGSVNGFVTFHPDSIKDNTVIPPVYITGMKVLEKERPLTTTKIELPYDQNFLAFDFVTLNYNSPEKNQYAYQLVGLDQNWVYSGTRRYASYPGLAPGKYTFRVKASNNDGVWNEQGASLIIHIKPPYWHTWWFILGATTLFVIGSVVLIKQREKNIIATEAQKTELEKLKALRYLHQLEIEQVNNFFAASVPDRESPEAILRNVAHNCIGKLSGESCAIYLLANNEPVLVPQAAWVSGSPELPARHPVNLLREQGITGKIAATGKAEIKMDFVNGVQQTIIAVPMLNHGKVTGVITSTHAQPDFYTEHYLQLLTTIASQCADRINKAAAEQEVRQKETELINLNRNLAISRLKTLQSQMNPHFIFNSLNSIQYFIATNDKQAAMSYLAKFARLVRQILDSSVSGRVKLSDELEILTNYMALEQLRLENSFDFAIRVDDKIIAENLEIPSLLLQPYVENAILHGLRHLTGRLGQLTVEICKMEAGINCVIEDNGIGRQKSGTLKPASHHSMATELSQRRLSEMVSVTSLYQGARVNTIDLYDRAGHAAGTRVEILIPVFVDIFSADELVHEIKA